MAKGFDDLGIVGRAIVIFAILAVFGAVSKAVNELSTTQIFLVVGLLAVLAICFFYFWTRTPAKPWKGKARYPIEGKRISMPSESQEDISYIISPASVTCSCPDFQEKRADTPQDSPCRVCKHLMHYYVRHPDDIPSPLTPFTDIFVHLNAKDARIPYAEPGIWSGVIEGAGTLVTSWTESLPWVNVYVGNKKYGYNIDEKRWSYGEQPGNADKILPLLPTILKKLI